MTKSHFKSVVASFVASLMLSISGIFGVAPASAVDDFSTYLLVSPASQTLGVLDPGKTYSGEFTVRNIGNEQFDYTVSAGPYTVSDEEYNYNDKTENKYTMISKWFEFSKVKGTLAPQEADKIQYTVTIPKDAPGGAQNAAIIVATDNAVEEGKPVSATAQAVMIVYSRVTGETNRCGKILEATIPTLLFKPPITASGRVENCGNVDLNVKYTMSVYPLFSDEEIYSNEEKPLLLATLPETRRYNVLEWEQTPSFGIYKVKLAIEYGDETKNIEKLVLVCPLWLIILIIVFIGAVVFWLVSRVKGRKKAKKEIAE